MNNIFSYDEFLEKTGITSENLNLWEKEKLLIPMGQGETHGPFYGKEQIAQADQIGKLSELGYGPEEIQKIIRKVGLPSSSAPAPVQDKGVNYLTVGNLAEKIGASPRTIKHWEEKGIIEPDMRSQGGFRLYKDHYVYICSLIQDLQHFGYSLEQVKGVSDYFRLYIQVKDSSDEISPEELENDLKGMLNEIDKLNEKIKLLRQGISRWEDLIKKRKKDILTIRVRNQKRLDRGDEK